MMSTATPSNIASPMDWPNSGYSPSGNRKALDIPVDTCELPPYTVRVSQRAKYVRLVVDAHAGLTVVLPRGVSPTAVPPLLRERRDWIQRHLQQSETQKKQLERRRKEADRLPDAISLPAIGQHYQLCYQLPSCGRFAVRQSGEVLHVSGGGHDPSATRLALRRWLRRCGKTHLPRMLADLSQDTGLSYTRLSIRGQKKRWGSCSSQGHIILNCKLLFLPPELALHVMLHELAHLKHHNHSAVFYRLLEALDPQCQVNRRRLRRQAWEFVPPWAEHPLTAWGMPE